MRREGEGEGASRVEGGGARAGAHDASGMGRGRARRGGSIGNGWGVAVSWRTRGELRAAALVSNDRNKVAYVGGQENRATRRSAG